MMLMNRPEYLYALFGNLTKLEGIGQKTSIYLGKLDIFRPIDFLYSMPTGLKQRKLVSFVSQEHLEENVIVKVRVVRHKLKKFGLPSSMVVSDRMGEFNLVFFNAKRDWLISNFPVDEELLISGKLERFNNQFQIIHPDYVQNIDQASSIPIPQAEALYSLTKGVSQKLFFRSVTQVLNLLPKEVNNHEWISIDRVVKNGWSSFKQSLERVHKPCSEDDFSFSSPFRLRLAYDDLFSHQICMALARNTTKKVEIERKPISEKFSKNLIQKLPFELTRAQNRCIKEIKNDLSNKYPMLRLLQGDVGSGKTLVAFISMLLTIENEGQCALMVPTELLAKQHYKNLSEYTAGMDISLTMLSGKTKSKIRRDRLEKIRTGMVQIIVGTHALFQKDVQFKNLQLVVIDEQHKFGVKQRLDLIEKGHLIDILVMTATPIPRTLQLTNYGDLDISIIDEKPFNRKKIDTAVISETKIRPLVKRLKDACEKGQQAYWVCPLIEDGENSDLVALERRYSALRKYCPTIDSMTLHGKMSEDQKTEIMNSFANGKIQVLLATTVIEVGIDVPRASIMIVEGAERFGLAQLHQLRGRVGRGNFPSSCTLVYSKSLSSLGRKRLEILRKTDNGFRIAEEDLRIRGGGDTLGLQQSGIPKFKLADLRYHADILSWAQEDARKIINENPNLMGLEGSGIRLLLFLMGREESLSLIRSS